MIKAINKLGFFVATYLVFVLWNIITSFADAWWMAWERDIRILSPAANAALAFAAGALAALVAVSVMMWRGGLL